MGNGRYTKAELGARLDRVMEGLAEGKSQREIARIEGVDESIISRDIRRIASDEYRMERAHAILHILMGKIDLSDDGNVHQAIKSITSILRIPVKPLTEEDVRRITREQLAEQSAKD